jgi:hypothetical protein
LAYRHAWYDLVDQVRGALRILVERLAAANSKLAGI